MRTKKEKDTEKITSKAAEKLAQPAAPLALGAQLKVAADTQAKLSGKKNWLIKNNLNITIVLGLIWGIAKVLYFYYETADWAIGIKIIDSFFPLTLVLVAAGYRTYPYLSRWGQKQRKKVFAKNKKKTSGWDKASDS